MKNEGCIVLKSNILVVNKILKRTRAKVFKDLKVGDKIQLSVEVKYAGRRGGGTYATYILVENIETKDCVGKTFNELSPLLDNFEFIEEK